MCLIVFAWQPEQAFPLVVSANRDEFFRRPTAPLAPWDNSPVIAGRDLQAGGTWLGVTASGRFAAVTNFRHGPDMQRQYPLSRGQLCQTFLEGGQSPQQFLSELTDQAMQTGGFNLIVGDRNTLAYASNRFTGNDGDFCYRSRILAPGVYGLSNHLLDSPWPKLSQATERFRCCLSDTGLLADTASALSRVAESPLFELLRDTRPAPDGELPDTGIGTEQERFLSPAFITGSLDYGTRASTILIRHRTGQQTFAEQTWLPEARPGVRTLICLQP